MKSETEKFEGNMEIVTLQTHKRGRILMKYYSWEELTTFTEDNGDVIDQVMTPRWDKEYFGNCEACGVNQDDLWYLDEDYGVASDVHGIMTMNYQGYLCSDCVDLWYDNQKTEEELQEELDKARSWD